MYTQVDSSRLTNFNYMFHNKKKRNKTKNEIKLSKIMKKCVVLILNIVFFPFSLLFFCFCSFKPLRQFSTICLKIIAFCVCKRWNFNINLYYFTVVLWVLQQIRFVFVLQIRLFFLHDENCIVKKNRWKNRKAISSW